MREDLFSYASKEGVLVAPQAAEFLLGQSDPVRSLKDYFHLLKEKPFLVTLEDLRERVEIAEGERASNLKNLTPTKLSSTSEPRTPIKSKPHIKPEQLQGIKVLMDLTGTSNSTGTIDDFDQYFANRFQSLRELVLQTNKVRNPKPVSRLRQGSVETIAMVRDISTTKKGNRILTMEDESGQVDVLIPDDADIDAETIVQDEVLGVIGKMQGPRRMVIAESLVRPGFTGLRKSWSGTGKVAITSDVHVGSNTFLEDKWSSFVEWLGSDEASDINYLIIAGDLVDGVGVYPGQEEELDIPDVYDQYLHFAELLAPIPERIKILMIPGNHDAVRLAEPQPAFPEKITSMFSSNVLFLSNPAIVSIDGIEFLIYHGKGLDDLLTTIPGFSYQKPMDGMIAMMERRHMSPMYGGKTPISPECLDPLVIRTLPDVFITGHVHLTQVRRMNRILLINASTWQSQTSFQKMKNMVPDPGKAILIDMATGKEIIKAF